MKCGTTSMHHYLNAHPEISMSKIKELNFFSRDEIYRKGIKWYESHFKRNATICGESSPTYSQCHIFENVTRRMYSIIPDAKIIYMVRDPIERILSHYLHNFATGDEKRNIVEALTDIENNHYINTSKYFMQLREYLQYYSMDNILIITANELKKERFSTLQRVFKFLGVVESYSSSIHNKIIHSSSVKKRKNKLGQFLTHFEFKHRIKLYLPASIVKFYRTVTEREPIEKPQLDERLKIKIIEYLREDIDSFRVLTGKAFENWCL